MAHKIAVVAIAVVTAMVVAFFMANKASSEEAKIGDAVIELSKPESFCPLDNSKSADVRLLSLVNGALAGRNRLVGIYALCDELPKWRSGKVPLLTDMIQYQTVAALMEQKFPKPYAPLKKQICAQFRTQGQELLDKVSPAIEKRLQALSDGIEINQQRIFGIVEAPDSGCVVLILQKIKSEVGKVFTQLASFTPVVVKSKLIFVYLFVHYDPAKGGEASVKRVRTIAEVLERTNAGD